MSEEMLLLAAVLVIVSLSAAILAWVSSLRWLAQSRESMKEAVTAKDQALKARDEQLAGRAQELEALKGEIGFLKELESVRLVERYMEAKNGLEERLHRLETKRQRWRERVREYKHTIEELSQSRERKATELQTLRSELSRTQLDSRTLDQALQAVSTVGDIPVTDIRNALSRRRQRQAELTSRLEHLGLEGEARAAEIKRLEAEIERARLEAEQVEREIEITRAAGPILDSLLGITADMREKLARIDDQLDQSMRTLGSGSRRDPIADFLVAAAGETRERSLLLAGGAFEEGPAAGAPGGEGEAKNRSGTTDERDESPPEPASEEEDDARVVREALGASSRPHAGSGADGKSDPVR